jgi:hypothetical protein
MKHVRGFLVLVFVLAPCVVPWRSISAETITVDGGSIRIQSQILATHYIITDEQGTITEIVSNSTGAARQRVFVHKTALGNERVMTDEIRRQYQSILPSGKSSTTGTIYKKSEPQPIFLGLAQKSLAEQLLPATKLFTK